MEKEQKLASYSEYDRCGYNISDFYDYCLDNELEDLEEGMTKEEFCEKFANSDRFYEWESDLWECMWEEYFNDTCYEADKILGSKSFVRVSGSAGLWNGRRYVDKIIRETNLQDILRNYMNIDTLEVDVFEDRVEITNIHHDGTNHYTLTPFSYADLKKI